MTITYRNQKGTYLTYDEMDENIRDLYEDTTLDRVLLNGNTSIRTMNVRNIISDSVVANTLVINTLISNIFITNTTTNNVLTSNTATIGNATISRLSTSNTFVTNTLIVGTTESNTANIQPRGSINAIGPNGPFGRTSLAVSTAAGQDANNSNSSISFYAPFFGYAVDRGVRKTADIVSGFANTNFSGNPFNPIGTWGNEYISFNVGNNGVQNDNSNTTIERMRIDGTGNVTISGSLTDASSNRLLSENGYVVLPGGLIMQWCTGAAVSSETDTTTTFPMAFPTACLNVVVGTRAPDADRDGMFQVRSFTRFNVTSRFNQFNSAGGTAYPSVFAIGY